MENNGNIWSLIFRHFNMEKRIVNDRNTFSLTEFTLAYFHSTKKIFPQLRM